MKNLLIIFLSVSIFSCGETAVSIEDVSIEDVSTINIKSIKKLSKETYYTIKLDFEGKQIGYDYDDNREVLLGDFVKDVGIKDSKGKMEVSQSKLEGFYNKLIKVSEKSSNNGVIKTVIKVKSKKGVSNIQSSEISSVQELERYIQNDLLSSNVKILMN